jgi:FkbM family methyltransferase
MNKFLRKILNYVSSNKYIYRLAGRIVFDHDGENNCHIDTNGELDFLQAHAGGLKIIFDVGANVGDWVKTVLSINPSAQIHCFEPSEKTFGILCSNKFSENVVLNQLGLGSKKEQKEFFTYGDGSVINSVYNRSGIASKPVSQETVLIDTVSDYCREKNVEKIDLLKIDVEGGEFEVIKGAGDLINNGRIKVVQFEYGGTFIDAGVLLKDVFNFFRERGYLLYKIMPGRPVAIPEYSQKLENFHYANYLAVSREYSQKM